MNREKGFTLVELMLVITILGMLIGMTVPRFATVREQARIAAMKMNVHATQVVIEAFHSEKGYYADDFYEDGYGAYFPGGVMDQELGRLPTNPWTGKEMDPDMFNPEDYDKESDLSNTTGGDANSPNDQVGYYAGEIIYGVWEPEGVISPVGYGLVGIGGNGASIREYDADGEIVIFLLHS